MQDVLTYEAWLESVCHICNSLLKANVSIIGNEFKVVASKYRWITFIDVAHIRYAYSVGFEPAWGATELMKLIIDEWDKLLVEEDD
jgi:hypothetical protein|nr:MAG TPA: hypothetical protein [Caudoviricetes sp.]